MPFDRSAHRAQVARIVEHSAGGEVLLQLMGKGDALPAAIAADKPAGARALEGVSNRTLSIVTLARAVFDGALPREGQHFIDPAGKILRIEEDRSVPHASILVYACAVSAS